MSVKLFISSSLRSKQSKKYERKTIYLMSGVNEERFLVQHKSWECKCRLHESVCNSKQKWNHNKCQCECTELNNQGSCKNDYI